MTAPLAAAAQAPFTGAEATDFTANDTTEDTDELA
jgi:hypothetical protein